MGQKDTGICYTKFRQAFNMVWGSECQVANLHFSLGLGISLVLSPLFGNILYLLHSFVIKFWL